MPYVETARCTGHCCRAFVVPAVAEAGGLAPWKESVERRDQYRDTDDHRFIADMLVDLGREATIDPLTGVVLDPPQALYGCRHFDMAAGNCTAYDRRPGMCRTYPYDREGCAAAGCTHKREFRRMSVESVGLVETPPDPSCVLRASKVGDNAP